MTNTEYNKIVKNWENYIYTQAFNYTKRYNLDQMQQDDLIQEGYIAVYDAYQSYLTNGKTGNDANGLIKAYITGRIQTFCRRQVNVVRNANNYVDEDYTHYIPQDENQEEWGDDDWIAYQITNEILTSSEYSTHYTILKKYFGLDDEEKMTAKQIAEWFTNTYHHYVTDDRIENEIYTIKQKLRRLIRRKTHNKYRIQRQPQWNLKTYTKNTEDTQKH
jgi:DNA-directed RNA polymerase specialized sigma subunit